MFLISTTGLSAYLGYGQTSLYVKYDFKSDVQKQ